jgi:tol-pal system-associated acyl-CoA thioesterase
MLAADESSFTARVFYEDTDCTGFVHHVAFLRFLARARSEAFRAAGRPQEAWAERDRMFPAYAVKATFHLPARLGDPLRVTTRVRRASAYRLAFDQRVHRERDGALLVEAIVELVCTDLRGGLQPLPE